jgi:wobble nucleotide-excising tRNase
MITRISHLKEFGTFKQFTWDDKLAQNFQEVNVFFGYNGSGKTTISNIFYLMSAQSPTSKEALYKDLRNGGDCEIELEQTQGKLIKYPSNLQKPCYVFNRTFVSDHVYRGPTTNIRQFDKSTKISDQLKTPKIQTLEIEIGGINQIIEQITSQISALQNDFEKIKQEGSDTLNRYVSGSRLTNWSMPMASTPGNLEEMQEALEGERKKYEMATNQDGLEQDIALLNECLIPSLNLDIEKIILALNTTIASLARKKIKEKLSELETTKLKHAKTHADWLEDGFVLISQLKDPMNCPLCGTDILGVRPFLIEEYASYFDASYKDLIDSLNLNERLTEEALKSIPITYNKLQTINVLLGKYADNKVSKKIESISISLQGLGVNKALELVKSFINEKRKDQSFNLENRLRNLELKNAESIINAYGTIKTDLNDNITSIIRKLKSIKLDKGQTTNNLKNLIKNIGNIKFDQLDSAGSISKLKDLEIGLNEKTVKITALRTELSSEIAKLKLESKYLNEFLKRLGVFNFHVDINSSSQIENLSVHYISGEKKSNIENCLSEGEKTTLAFAYFLSKTQYELIDNPSPAIKDTIIVIDDPVSSLDDNRLYATAYIICQIYGQAGQLFILSHNLTFLRFISNILGADRPRGDYLIKKLDEKNTGLVNLPDSLQNFQTSYFQKLEEIFSYLENPKEYYEAAKKYLPAYIRVTLESFLSLKFQLLKQGSSGQKYLVAGLDKIIKTIKSDSTLFNKFDSVGNITAKTLEQRLSTIKKFTDPQCHGSTQNIEEFTYLSNSELTEIAQDCLDIIKFIDRIHFESTTK